MRHWYFAFGFTYLLILKFIFVLSFRRKSVKNCEYLYYLCWPTLSSLCIIPNYYKSVVGPGTRHCVVLFCFESKFTRISVIWVITWFESYTNTFDCLYFAWTMFFVVNKWFCFVCISVAWRTVNFYLKKALIQFNTFIYKETTTTQILSKITYTGRITI